MCDVTKLIFPPSPDAVNEDFDVFTGNTRGVLMLDWRLTGAKKPITVAFVSVGALLVGSNIYTGSGANQDHQRGEELGYFAYGVSDRTGSQNCMLIYSKGLYLHRCLSSQRQGSMGR